MAYTGFGLEQISPAQKKPYNELTPEEQGERGAEMIMNFMTSCPGKSVVSGVTGFALGGVLGLFMASMAYDTPLHTPTPANTAATATAGNIGVGGISRTVQQISDLPFRQQMKLQFTDMGKKSYSSAKNFGYIGMIYAGVECVIESLRAKNDIYNGVTAGFFTGAGLAYKAGPQTALMGGAGFAAFSAAIDLYMKSEDGRPPQNDFKE
ncbi:ANL_collapsed_G0006660.mRNA.1.CDS.1 [Saccharomyces cerevisiae]|nr:ANL_HP_G0186670.mRNA.1.CDS.1 [Saccharomyces cerevisiae]CAI4932729.1 ANL_HP_G0203240.mRNA.1.CDS.1 [Saccharomyces cerevisiae]CAI5045675.1 ANL_HP_G0087580.mRNA.1.CDS.1 [Saccharomyces cerevisiae]CAI5181458.1 ANL_HP_G0131960.mRNA.1.CDS.1 [Saccharomyces cerevisiae]CAI5205644.1 ANL_HP_G0149370.mRNA.1.CDS.1 [Saccharomyces cerevisiae]